ncbi:MAG: hypothetical protein AAGI68_00910 [Planctomycetota bacterium]
MGCLVSPLTAQADIREKRDQDAIQALPELGLEVEVPEQAALVWPVRAVKEMSDKVVPGLIFQRHVTVRMPDPVRFRRAKPPHYTIDFWQMVKPVAAKLEFVMDRFRVLRAELDQRGIATEPAYTRDFGQFKLGILRAHTFGGMQGEYLDSVAFVAFAQQKRVNNEVVDTGLVSTVAVITFDATDEDTLKAIDAFLFALRPHPREAD